jgi:SPFH domain/Band 7 family protein
MAFVRAKPNQYLLTGGGGRLVNRGSAVQVFLLPGSIWVVVPSTKQEARFEFTQETRDGIPLRFKGIVIYRITDPVAAAAQFDFTLPSASDGISELLTDLCLGELRHAVSHMTMVECIEQRKTTLSDVVTKALESTIRAEGAVWGLTVEVAQVAQVFIVDAELRQQLEAEVRNEIRLKSDQSEIGTREAVELAEIVSATRVEEQRLAADRERLRREQELRLAEIERDRRLRAEAIATEQRNLELEVERFRTQMASDQTRVEVEAPVRLLKIREDAEALQAELAMRELRTRVQSLKVDEDLAMRRAEQKLREAILPIEQAPAIVDAASRILQGTNLSIYGEQSQLVGQLAPVFETLARAVQRATQPAAGSVSGGAQSA